MIHKYIKKIKIIHNHIKKYYYFSTTVYSIYSLDQISEQVIVGLGAVDC